MTARFSNDIERRHSAHLYRSLSLPRGIDLSSNDYLGLAVHPLMLDAAHRAIDDCAMIGAAGSRLLRGHHPQHEALEQRAAEIFDAPSALYLSSGFQANYALLTTLPSRHDVVIYDECVHASARDGIAAMQAKSLRVKHNDLSAFEGALKSAREKRRTDGMIWLVVESVYSMDGDIAPICDLYDLAAKYDAWLIVDEAHATGVFGASGRGFAHEIGAKHGYDRLITLHTCGKAIGAAGALICAQSDVIEYMVNASRPFIYSTAPMPLQAACTQAGLELMISAEGDQLRRRLFQHIDTVKDEIGGAHSQIIPLMIGDDGRAVSIAQNLQGQGFDIRAVRPPTVPSGTARLRLSLSALLNADDLKAFLKAYKDVKHG